MKEAAENAKTYLLFQPEDPIMIENFKYYLKVLNLDASDVAVRKVRFFAEILYYWVEFNQKNT